MILISLFGITIGAASPSRISQPPILEPNKNKPIAEELALTTEQNELISFLSGEEFIKDKITQAAKKFQNLLTKSMEEKDFKAVLDLCNDGQREILYEMSVIANDSLSRLLLSNLKNDHVAREYIRNLDADKLRNYIRKVHVYVQETGYLVEALLERVDRKLVLEIAEGAVLNPEKVLQKDPFFGDTYRSPQPLLFKIIERLAPKYPLDRIGEFYKIAFQDGNMVIKTWISRLIKSKYKREDLRKLYLDLINERNMKIEDGDKLHPYETLKIQKMALCSLVSLDFVEEFEIREGKPPDIDRRIQKDTAADLIEIARNGDPNLSIYAISILSDKTRTNKEDFQALKGKVVEDIKAGNYKVLYLLANLRSKNGTDEGHNNSSKFDVEPAAINNYNELVEAMLRNVDETIFSSILNREKFKNLKLNGEEFISNEITVLENLASNVGIEDLVQWITLSTYNEVGPRWNLRNNAHVLLKHVDMITISDFLEKHMDVNKDPK